MRSTSAANIEARPMIVGSISTMAGLNSLVACGIEASCDIIEIRLDGLARETNELASRPWNGLKQPLLFTARRHDEGGAIPATAAERMTMLEPALEGAAWVDVELASAEEMAPILKQIHARGIPWICSTHNFQAMPDSKTLVEYANRARELGAAVFKVAAMVRSVADLVTLAEFQRLDQKISKSTMGMGELAVVSRLLCAQCGSVLNYGYLSTTPTAPGQWSAEKLKAAIDGLPGFQPNLD